MTIKHPFLKTLTAGLFFIILVFIAPRLPPVTAALTALTFFILTSALLTRILNNYDRIEQATLIACIVLGVLYVSLYATERIAKYYTSENIELTFTALMMAVLAATLAYPILRTRRSRYAPNLLPGIHRKLHR